MYLLNENTDINDMRELPKPRDYFDAIAGILYVIILKYTFCARAFTKIFEAETDSASDCIGC
jgi:hypothetical protein